MLRCTDLFCCDCDSCQWEKVRLLELYGHSHACAMRIVWGDGSCECMAEKGSGRAVKKA